MSNLAELLRMQDPHESDHLMRKESSAGVPTPATSKMTDRSRSTPQAYNYSQQQEQEHQRPQLQQPVTSTIPLLSHSKSLDDLVTSHSSSSRLPPVTPLPMVVVTHSQTASTTATSDNTAAMGPSSSYRQQPENHHHPNHRGASQRRGTEDYDIFNDEEITRRYEMPRCYMPENKNDLTSMETFVMNAFLAHEQNEQQKRRKADEKLIGNSTVAATEPPADENGGSRSAEINPAHLKGYQGLIRILVRPDDPTLLRKIFVALRTAGHGSVLQRLSLSEDHAKMSHLIFRFVSTRPSDTLVKEVMEYHATKTTKDETEKADTAMTSLGLPTHLMEKLQVYEDYTLCDAHFHLLLGMVSTRPTRSKALLTAIWKLLTKVPNQPEQLTHRLHSMLHTILRLIPKAKNDFFPIIQTRFPFWRWQKEFLLWYVTQSFRVLEYFPSLRSQVFEMIIISCLELDVNILIKDNGSVTFDESEEQRLANMAKEAEIQKEDGETANAFKSNNDESIDEVSDKLDAILEMLFRKIQSCASHDVKTARRLFRDLLPTFERSVLPTHKAKFVQFCMFLSCAIEAQAAAQDEAKGPSTNTTGHKLAPVTPEPTTAHHDDDDEDLNETILDREFASKLIEIVVDPYRATTTRQSSACYLASFVSRASFVKIDTVCESISALLSWAEAYIETLGPNAVRAADSRKQAELHAMFYTACQAAFYIMSFRGKEAVEYYREMISNDEQTNQDLDGTTVDGINISTKRWTNLCGHPLQPLRFCLESVRSEFLHVAHFFELIEESVLNRLVADAKRISSGRVNKKAASTICTAATLQLKRKNGGVGGLGHGSNPLKSFFPFDPLLLRRTHEFIEPIYRNWGGPVEEEDVLVIDDVPGEEIIDEIECDFPEDGSEDDSDIDDNGEVFEMEADQEQDESNLTKVLNGESACEADRRELKDVVSSMRKHRFQLQLSPMKQGEEGDEDQTSVDENYRARSGTLSTVNSDPGANDKDPIFGTPQKAELTAAERKEMQKKAWTDTLAKAKKRPRSTSMDGSW
mmetsp:Transcript_52541/g.127265  ORF Transcript_52541/g.127265 Transcript_52541/m.127265 type:complete len:1034 (-) Transcript_52541:119-3220(-)